MDTPGYLTMSAKELNRLEVLRRVLGAPTDPGAGGRAAGPRGPSDRAAVPKASDRGASRVGVEEARAAEQPEAA